MEAELENALETTLDALCRIQREVSLILGAKAVEAEKARNWILNHLKEESFPSQMDRFAACMQIHDLQIEVIEGLIKLCNGLSRSMRIVLHPDQDDASGMMPSYAGGFMPEEPGR